MSAPPDLESLNSRHLRNSDKYFRMFAGAASFLTAFEDSIIFLDLRVDHRLTIPLEKITRNIARSWHGEEELRTATGYVAHIYKTERPSGFAVALQKGPMPRHIAEEFCRQVKLIPAESEYPDVLLAVLQGSFAKEAGAAAS